MIDILVVGILSFVCGTIFGITIMALCQLSKDEEENKKND